MARRTEGGWRTFVLVACAVGLVAAHAPLIGYKTFANVDEAYAAALAQRINEGHRLYEGAISQRGPLMYYAFAALAKLTRWDDVVAVRVAALLFALAHVLVVLWAGTRLLSRRAGVLAAALSTYALVVGLPPIDGMALHAESMQVPLLTCGAALAVVGTRARARTRARLVLAVAGTLFGAAIAVKHAAMFQPLPVVLLLVSEARRRTPRGVPFGDVASFVGGVVLVPLLFVAHAAAIGTLDSLVYYTITYNLKVHLRPSDALLSASSLVPLSTEALRGSTFVAGTLGAIIAAVTFVARRGREALRSRSAWVLLRGFDVRAYLTLHLLVAVASASAMYRFFAHYYVPAVPFLTLAVAAWAARGVSHLRSDVVRVASVVIGLTMIFVGGLAAYYYEKIDGRVAHDPVLPRLGAYVEATTTPEAKIFVWGFSPWIYQYSHRRPAGRYVFVTYVTGFVPWFYDALEKEKSRTVPGSLEALLADLDAESPDVVVDAGSVMIARPMRAYPPAAGWLHAKYCFEVRIGAYDVYRKKADGQPCATGAFPFVHVPVDFWGNALTAVAMPVPVDTATSRPLCKGTYASAAWFSEAPPARLDLVAPDKREERLRNEAAGAALPEDLAPPVTCTAENPLLSPP